MTIIEDVLACHFLSRCNLVVASVLYDLKKRRSPSQGGISSEEELKNYCKNINILFVVDVYLPLGTRPRGCVSAHRIALRLRPKIRAARRLPWLGVTAMAGTRHDIT
jgi:hypothetical protein